MHHGCLLFNTDLSVLSKALEAPKDKIESKSTKSVRSLVDNILPNLPDKISIEEFSDKLLKHMKAKFPEMKEYKFTEEELAEIEQLRASKFGTWEWNYGNSPKFDIERQTRYTAGKIQVFADVESWIIQNIKFYGTFFGNNSNLSEVESTLKGVKYTPEAVKEALSKIEFNDYFAGFSLEELTEAIVDG
jgi:lipoate-protein ligase A